jgi:hypothetical protein
MADDLTVKTALSPDEALRALSDAIGRKIPYNEAKEALEQVLRNYEEQLRVFMVGVAKGKIDRVLRMLNLLDRVEEELFSERAIKQANVNQLIRIYALGQNSLTTSLDYIRRVADMRAEIERLGAASKLDEALAKATESGMGPDGLPLLSPVERERVRGFFNRMVSKTIDVPVEDGDPNN